MNNVRQSKKRDAMLALLQRTVRHPSADWVYQQMKGEFPDLSLGTVYRNLNHLYAHGLIRRVGVVNGQERYDGMVAPHSHFICDRCGTILDLPKQDPGEDYLEAVGVQYGFKAEGCEFIVRGVCRDCVGDQTEADP